MNQTNLFDHLRREEEEKRRRGCLVHPEANRPPIRWEGWTDEKYSPPWGMDKMPHHENWEFDHEGVTYFLSQNDKGWTVSYASDESGWGWPALPDEDRPPIIEAFLAQKPEPPR